MDKKFTELFFNTNGMEDSRFRYTLLAPQWGHFIAVEDTLDEYGNGDVTVAVVRNRTGREVGRFSYHITSWGRSDHTSLPRGVKVIPEKGDDWVSGPLW